MRFPRKVATLLAGVLLFFAAVGHAAHVVRRVSIVAVFLFAPVLALAAACSDAADAAAVSNWNTYQKPQTPWCTATTAVKEIVPNAPYADIVYYYVYGNCTDSGAPYRAIGTFTCSEPACTAQNKVADLFVRFATIDSAPDVTMANAASVTAIATAFYALGDTPTVCYQGCVHDLIPLPSDPDGVYYKPSNGPYELYRGYNADRSNTVCTGPGNAGTSASISPVTSATVAPVASGSSGTSTGGGTGSGCTAGDTRAGCAELGTPTNETIPGVTVTLPGFAPETQHFGGGQCPANVFMTFNGVGKNLKVWDWQYACDVLVTYIKPMVLTLGALAAFFILLGMPQPGSVSSEGA